MKGRKFDRAIARKLKRLRLVQTQDPTLNLSSSLSTGTDRRPMILSRIHCRD